MRRPHRQGARRGHRRVRRPRASARPDGGADRGAARRGRRRRGRGAGGAGEGVPDAGPLPHRPPVPPVAAADRGQRDPQRPPRRRTPLGAGGARAAVAAARGSLDPAVEVADREAKERLLAAVDRLPEAMRRVVVCRYLLDLDEATTAVVLGAAARHRQVAAEPRAAPAARGPRHRRRSGWTMPDAIEQRLAELAARPAGGRARRARRRGHGAGPRRPPGPALATLGGRAPPRARSPVASWPHRSEPRIREWFGFHGVAVTSGDPVTSSPTVPAASGDSRRSRRRRRSPGSSRSCPTRWERPTPSRSPTTRPSSR